MADLAPSRRAAVLGSPIAHSLSPALHRAAYAGLGLLWTYDAIEMTAERFPAFLAGLDDSWAGLSLTMPLKESAIALVDDVDELAGVLGSANTVLPTPAGWRGANTDVYGMTQALRGAGLLPGAVTATVLGAGATARSALAALAALGAVSVTVCARRPEAAERAVRLAGRLGLRATATGLEPQEALVRADVVISTLPGSAGAPWALLAPEATGALLDASYHPWPTPIASAWGSSVVASGRDMLLWQAVEQVRLMTGREPAIDLMSAALPA